MIYIFITIKYYIQYTRILNVKTYTAFFYILTTSTVSFFIVGYSTYVLYLVDTFDIHKYLDHKSFLFLNSVHYIINIY